MMMIFFYIVNKILSERFKMHRIHLVLVYI